MKTLLLIIVAAVSVNAAAQENPKYLNVLAVNGLNMRSKPDAQTRVVTRVAYGKRVEILERTKVDLQLGWVSDHWYRVRYRGREGYIFGGYLSELKAPKKIQSPKLSDLLPVYCAQMFTMRGSPIETLETGSRGDTLKHTLVKFTNGMELELEHETDRNCSTLILPFSVQQTYILLEALLKQSGNHLLLNELRFVKGKDGQLARINSVDGTVYIQKYADRRTMLKLVTFVESN